mmetsp:Transcript_8024/g.11025  ORF Transcript_8024/g.11025 Transcript_8024/m.11025 type:complete len:445 (-) Transcript_8024:70-1404(-)
MPRNRSSIEMLLHSLFFLAPFSSAAWYQGKPQTVTDAYATKSKIMDPPTVFPEMSQLQWAEMPPMRGAFRTPEAGVCIAARLFSMVKYQMDQCLVQFPLTVLPVNRTSEYQEAGVHATKVSLLEIQEDYWNPYFDSRWCAKQSDKWGLVARGEPEGYPTLREGEFVTVLGSANSYGATVDNGKAWTEILGKQTGTQFINIATGGAGPGYYIAGWPQFERYLTKAKLVVVQAMSGRSVAIPRFLPGSQAIRNLAVLGCDLKWKVQGQGVDVLPFLQTLWNTNRTTARALLNEMRQEQEKEYLQLADMIKTVNPNVKVAIMWMSKRDLDNTFTPDTTENIGKIMDFPHFVDKTMMSRIGLKYDYLVNVKRPQDISVESWESELVDNHYCGCESFAKDVCSLSEYRNNFERNEKCACKAVRQDYYSTSTVHAQTAKQIGEILASLSA